MQVALCEPHDVLERKLALKPRGSAYQTWLFDDASLSLLDRGVRLRLRSKPDGAELTLKVGGQDCDALPRGAVPKREGKCEFDVYDGTAEGVVSLTTTLNADAARELLAGRLSAVAGC